MELKNVAMVICTLAAVVIAGCGGGGGGGGGGTVTQPVTAQLKLATQGTLAAGKSVGALDLTVTLPDGVTVKANADGSTQAGVVVSSGVALPAGSSEILTSIYAAKTATTPAQVRITYIKATGFPVGEFVTVNGDIAAGAIPKATDFTVAFNRDVNAKEMIYDVTDAALISGLSLVLTADIR